jgi:glucose-6-phosphate 1-epimerase
MAPAGGPADDPCAPVEALGADGTVLRGCRHGGQVLSWRPGGGADRLWVSRDTGCGPGVAVRGGIPVCWPQFSDRGSLPKHGLVRDRAWALAGADRSGAALLRFTTTDDDASRQRWPHKFTLELTARATAAELEVRLTVRNTGPTAFAAAAALHAYLRTSDAGAVTVEGLAGCRAEDNSTGGVLLVRPGALRVGGPVDLAVREVGHRVVLRDPGLGDLAVDADGFPDRVVWNPGLGRAPVDVHPVGEAEFVCVEPAALDPVHVAPGSTWDATARWSVL